MTKPEIERLKSSLRIEEVIGRRVDLERKGSNYTGLCPFHDDHHPSLVVNPQKQTFKCFACGEQGDVIRFVEKMDGCGFMEAVETLQAGVGALNVRRQESFPKKTGSRAKPLPTVDSQGSVERNRQFLSSLLPYACGVSELTPAYLDFEVGLSPVNVAREWYGMRNRIIFPIRDEKGQLIAFAARSLTEENRDEPKYINTSTAGGYKKGEHLYALCRAGEAIATKGFAFVVEGYKDAIAMHAAGFTNTVALCGTALTVGQVALLKKYTNRICLLLDGDRAGREAARKIRLADSSDELEIQTLYLPEGDDPDSLFRRHGREVFAALVNRMLSKPHLSEEVLLAACLLYADTVYLFKGELCLFTELLDGILRTDELLFENDDNRRILSHLAKGHLESALEPVLRGVADGLHAGYDEMVAADRESFCRLYPDASNGLELYLTRLLFLYLENRILEDIRSHIRELLKSSPDAGEFRLKTLVHIANRREQLRHVAKNLDRPGAVVG